MPMPKRKPDPAEEFLEAIMGARAQLSGVRDDDDLCLRGVASEGALTLTLDIATELTEAVANYRRRIGKGVV
jgi:hypothetical protein